MIKIATKLFHLPLEVPPRSYPDILQQTPTVGKCWEMSVMSGNDGKCWEMSGNIKFSKKSAIDLNLLVNIVYDFFT